MTGLMDNLALSPQMRQGLMEVGGSLLGTAYNSPGLAQGIQSIAQGFGPKDSMQAAQERLLAAQAAELERKARAAEAWQSAVGGSMGGTGIAGGGGIGSLATNDPRMRQIAMAGGGGVPMGPTPQAASLMRGGAGLMDTPRPPPPGGRPDPSLGPGQYGPVSGTFPEVSPAQQGDPRNFLASLSPTERAYAAQSPDAFFDMLKFKQGQKPKGKTPTNVMKNAEALGLVPGTPEHAEYIRAVTMRPSSQVNVGVSSAPPAGYRYVYDDQGRISSMEAIPGGPAARKIAEEEAKVAEAAEMEEAQAAQAAQSAGIVTQDIDRVMNLIDEGNPMTGLYSGIATVPGTAAHDAQRLLDTVRANVGFDKLQAMRAASPTGGALGQVSERENALLQATAGSLELSQTEDQLRENLRRLKGQTMGAVHGLNPYSASATEIQGFLENPGVEDLPPDYVDMIEERMEELGY